MSKFVMIDSHTFPNADFHQEKEVLEKDNIECVLAKCKTDDDVVEAAYDADVIGDNLYRITDELLQRLPNLKMIVRYGIGYDVVDVDACTKHGVLLCNLPRFCIEDVATHAMAFTLDMCRRVTLLNGQVRAGNWDVDYGYPTHRLSSVTVGLLGFGNIARQYKKYIQAFSPRIIAYDPNLSDEVFTQEGVERVSLDELLAQSDIISLHVPSVPDTYHIINEDSISRMKDGVMIVNTARGALIDMDALVAALKSGKVRAACADVFEEEPITDTGNEMFKCENLIVTPHVSYNSAESSDELHTQVGETAAAYLTGKQLSNVVNKELLK